MSQFNFRLSPEDGLPPDQVRFVEVRVEPWPDGQRVRVHLTLTPFEKRPDLEAAITDSQGQILASASIIESMDNRLVFTLHLRGESISPPFRLEVKVIYADLGEVDLRQVDFFLDAHHEQE